MRIKADTAPENEKADSVSKKNSIPKARPMPGKNPLRVSYCDTSGQKYNPDNTSQKKESRHDPNDLNERFKIANKKYSGPGENRIEQINTTARTVMEIIIKKQKTRYLNLVAKVRELQEKRYKIVKQPTTKEDLLKAAREQLRRKKEEILINKILLPHFQKCQQNRSKPLSEASVNGEIFWEDAYWMLLYLILTEKDIERAVALLPDEIGVSEQDKEAENKKIDKEIIKIKEAIEKEYKDLNDITEHES